MSETVPSAPKTKISDLKRRALLDAAMTEFESRGLDGASLRSIAATAGVTTGAIYSMFGGKSDLYAALLFESLDRLEAYVRAAAQAQSDPLEAVARACLDGAPEAVLRGVVEGRADPVWVARLKRRLGLEPDLDA